MSETGDTTRLQPEALIMTHGARQFVIPPDFKGLFAIGRHSSCQILLDSTVVSRLHGCVRVAGAAYVYRDTSSNGTVLLDGHDETLVQQSEVVLPESGSLRIGAELLHFHRRPP